MVELANVQHKTVSDAELRKLLGVPVDKPVSLGYFSLTYIYPDKKWLFKWVEMKKDG